MQAPRGVVYQIRQYRNNDEIELAKFFNGVYENYSGFVPRTPEYWLWCCLNRPTVEKEGICIVEEGDRIIGYAVAAINPYGPRVECEVLEFCYDPSHGRPVVSKLFVWVSDYAKERKVDIVSLDLPDNDNLLRRIAGEFGFDEFPHPQPLIKIVDICHLVQKISESRRALLQDQNEIYQVQLLNTVANVNPKFTIQIDKGKVDVMPRIIGVATVRIETDIDTLTSCIFGVSNVFKKILFRRLKIYPFWKISKVLKLFSALRLNDQWYIPRGDFG